MRTYQGDSDWTGSLYCDLYIAMYCYIYVETHCRVQVIYTINMHSISEDTSEQIILLKLILPTYINFLL